jgi:hypothetical protein
VPVCILSSSHPQPFSASGDQRKIINVLNQYERFNYILWLQDLLDSTSADYRESYDPNREVIAVDMSAPTFSMLLLSLSLSNAPLHHDSKVEEAYPFSQRHRRIRHLPPPRLPPTTQLEIPRHRKRRQIPRLCPTEHRAKRPIPPNQSPQSRRQR